MQNSTTEATSVAVTAAGSTTRAHGTKHAPGSRVLFLFPHPIADEVQKVAKGESPTERLYGAHELAALGWDVRYSDSRFFGSFGRFLKFLRQFGVIGVSFGTIADIARSDVVVVKDDFSAVAAIVTRLLGRKLVFLDSMFAPPQRWWKTVGTWISLHLAHETICYSEHQKQVWKQRFGTLAERIRVLPYTVDVSFYRKLAADELNLSSRRVLAVGRDVGRDYASLVEALRGTDLKLDLITLPYLLRGIPLDGNDQVIVHQRLSYEALFDLYKQAAVVVIPLKPGISYPSGIRALFEAMILKRPFVATRNEVLLEYMEDGVHGFMVPPKDPAALREAILACVARGKANEAMVASAADLVQREYDQGVFARALDGVLRRLTGRSPATSE